MQRSLRVAAAVVIAALAGFAASGSSHASRGSVVSVPSHALRGTQHIRIVLPTGYGTDGKRYPVVYFLHGLPGTAESFLGNDWVTDALRHAGRAILVFPQGARAGDTDPEYLNWGSGRNWRTFIGEELPHFVDTHFRTIANRSGRAIIGLSAGGYGATVIGLHQLGTFSVIESWSGYFHPTDPSGTKPLARGPKANVHTLIGELRSRPTFFAFYVGRSDTRFRAENVQLDRELTAAHIRHVFALYSGGHQTSLWEKHAKGWLAMALRRLAPVT